jgi:hypothetical protein
MLYDARLRVSPAPAAFSRRRSQGYFRSVAHAQEKNGENQAGAHGEGDQFGADHQVIAQVGD